MWSIDKLMHYSYRIKREKLDENPEPAKISASKRKNVSDSKSTVYVTESSKMSS
jgi:hypothetical protein